MLQALAPHAVARTPSAQEVAAWRRRYVEALARFQEAGLRPPRDRKAGADAYVALRGQWNARVERLADLMLYQREAIDGRAGAGG